MKRWTLHQGGLDDDELAEIAALILDEGVVVLPTDTIYGLHGLAMSERAVEKMRAAKSRPEDQPFVVLCGETDDMAALEVEPAPGILDALGRLWPAPLTAILPLRYPIPASAGRGSIAVRIPDLGWLRNLIRMTGPIASTSLNRSGEIPVTTPSAIPPDLLSNVGGVVDGAVLEGQPSTIVQFTESSPRILREGAFGFTQNLWKTVWKSL